MWFNKSVEDVCEAPSTQVLFKYNTPIEKNPGYAPAYIEYKLLTCSALLRPNVRGPFKVGSGRGGGCEIRNRVHLF